MKMEKNTVKELLHLLISHIIRESLQKMKLLVMVNIIGKMVNVIKDNGKIAK